MSLVELHDVVKRYGANTVLERVSLSVEAGEIIAEGVPDHVRHDPAVISSYLGTDERAIERSDEVRLRAPVTPDGIAPDVVPEAFRT